ncbi:MAG: hypothetical protein ABIC19_04600, partial [Patescibacteria group bacterium]
MKFFSRSLFLLILFVFLIFAGIPENWRNFPISSKIYKARATNYLTNPSFSGGSTGWTLSTSIYDSSYYQDSAGSVKTATAVGRNNTITGDASQTIGTNISSADTIELSLYWSKQCVAIDCVGNTVSVEIAKPSAPSTWVTIWSDTSIPGAGSATSWTGPSGLDVSSYFDETGEYKIRLYADLRNGNSKTAQALAWFDNVNLDVSAATISVSISDGVVSYGMMAENATKDTTASGLNDSQTATNDGNVTEDFNIKGQNSGNWTLAGTNGSDAYRH